MKRRQVISEYRSWSAAKSRCNNPKHKNYVNYGARGITMCQRWDSFDTFLKDMGRRPTGMTLERNDNDAGYSPENCRWATPKEQGRNRRSNRIICCRTLAEWCELSGLPKTTLMNRLARGATLSEALTRPVCRYPKIAGKTVGQWARELGVRPKMIQRRLRDGWAPREAVSVPPISGRPKGCGNHGKKGDHIAA